MAVNVEFTLSYTGRNADNNEIDFYDVADALVGFQRYLALTTHLILNNEIITQAPTLKSARIYALPPEEGSWKLTAAVAMMGTSLTAVGAGIFAVGTADKETPMGNLGRSVYDYVISETTGVHPDYEKTIGQQYREEKRKNPNFPDLTQAKLDSLIEKCQSAIYRMHRPIIASKTAKEATISMNDGRGHAEITGTLSKDSYDYMAYSKKDEVDVVVVGRITSYNVHTYKGRIYLPIEKRPIPFILSENARTAENIDQITTSLSATAKDKINDASDIRCFAFRSRSRNDRLKSLVITTVLVPK